MDVPGKKASKTRISIIQSSSEDFEVFCQPCDQADVRLPAAGYCIDCEEHLCETCFKNHTKPKPSRHHRLQDKHSMPDTLQLPTSPTQSKASDSLTKPCFKHKKKTVKYYCHDHNALLCSVCVTLGHSTSSCKVNYIPDVSEQAVDSDEYTSVLSNLATVSNEFKNVTEELKKLTEKSNNSLIDVLSDIRSFRKEINQRLDELEKATEEAANTLKKENDRRQNNAEKKCDEVIKSLEANSASIQQLNTTKQANILYVHLKLAQQLIKDSENMRKSFKTSHADIAEYHFKPNEVISSLLATETSLGTLASSVMPSQIFESVQFTADGNICVQTSEDADKCRITGMVHLSQDQLIITDSTDSNCSVKLFDINSSSVTHQIKLDTKPFDITTVTGNKLAITLPSDKSVKFISVSQTKLTKKNTVKVDGECYGISCQLGKLVLGFLSPPKVQVVDLKGKIITSVTTDSRNEDIFSCPFYVTTNSDSIYVSDSGKSEVTRLSWEGEVIGSYGDLGCPQGLALLDDESLVVCDIKDDRCSIQHVSADCTSGQVVMKDLVKHYAVCWCRADSKLYISSCCVDAENADFIQVFKLD